MIYFVRHGQTELDELDIILGQKDIVINDDGINQSNNLANALSTCYIDNIISSDLKRAQQTAEIINTKINKKVILDSRLRERNYGILEGKLRNKLDSSTWYILKKYPEILRAESNQEMYDRIKSFFEQTNFEKNTIIVTHIGVLRMILYYLDKKNLYDDKLYRNYYQRIDINHGSYFMYDGKKVIYPKSNTKTLH